MYCHISSGITLKKVTSNHWLIRIAILNLRISLRLAIRTHQTNQPTQKERRPLRNKAI